MASLRQFRRDARMTLTTPLAGQITANPIILPPTPGVQGPPQLRIKFRVSKSITPEPNVATVQAFNMSKISRDLAAAAVKDPDGWAPPNPAVDQRLAAFATAELAAIATGNSYLRLEAGYSGALGGVFEGNAMRVDSVHTGTDWVTTIEATDGGLGIEKGVANKSFTQNTTGLAVAAYLVKTMGFSGGNIPAAPPPALGDWTAKRGFVAQGKASDLLSTLCAGLDLEWFVDDGELWIVNAPIPAQNIPAGVLPGPPVFVSPLPSPATVQLLRKPRRTESDGVKIEALLNPQIRVGRSVTVQSSELAGAYRCEAVEHSGDNRGGTYRTVAYLRSLSPV